MTASEIATLLLPNVLIEYGGTSSSLGRMAAVPRVGELIVSTDPLSAGTWRVTKVMHYQGASADRPRDADVGVVAERVEE